jgi:hypothetical protein
MQELKHGHLSGRDRSPIRNAAECTSPHVLFSAHGDTHCDELRQRAYTIRLVKSQVGPTGFGTPMVSEIGTYL